MKKSGKNRREICEALGFSYFTFSDWVNGKKYPRMDKVEILADYFGILKSDLIEEKPKEHKEMQQKNGTIASAVIRMQNDDVFFSIVERLSKLDADKLKGVDSLLSAFSTTEK